MTSLIRPIRLFHMGPIKNRHNHKNHYFATQGHFLGNFLKFSRLKKKTLKPFSPKKFFFFSRPRDPGNKNSEAKEGIQDMALKMKVNILLLYYWDDDAIVKPLGTDS